MRCPKCGTDNQMNSSYCIRCGNKLVSETQVKHSTGLSYYVMKIGILLPILVSVITVYLCTLLLTPSKIELSHKEKLLNDVLNQGYSLSIQNDGSYAISRYKGDASELDIIDSVGDIPITKIEANAFSYNDNIISVSLPESIEELGKYAFASCHNLTDVDFSSSSIEIIGAGAFQNCNLNSAILNEGVREIGDSSFEYNYNLTEVTIPKSVSLVGKYAFRDAPIGELRIEGDEGEPLSVLSGAFTNYQGSECHLPGRVKFLDAEAFNHFNTKSIWLERSTSGEQELSGRVYDMEIHASDTLSLTNCKVLFMDYPTFYGPSGSKMEEFARNYDNVNFVVEE